MSEFKDRLTRFLKHEGVTKSEFSRIMGLSSGYVGSMRKSMPQEKIKRLLENFPQLNRDWLLYGEGEMLHELPSDYDGSQNNPEHLRDEFMVPLIPSSASAGTLSMVPDEIDVSGCEYVRSPIKGIDWAIMAIGDSMEPRIHSGTYLFLKEINQDAFIPWGKPMVIATENGTLVKVLMPSNESKEYVEAISYNPNYPPLQIPKSSIYKIYRIVNQVVPEECL